MTCTHFYCDIDGIINKGDSIVFAMYSRLWINTLIDEVTFHRAIALHKCATGELRRAHHIGGECTTKERTRHWQQRSWRVGRIGSNNARVTN